MSRPAGVAWPTPTQELLLRAALADGDEAVRLWEGWSAAVPLDDVDPGSHRLLPLLYRKLAAAGVEEERLAKLKGVYRHAWSRNQLLFHRVGQLLPRLSEAGIDTLLLKGVALSTLYYDDLGARPMDDIDLLVRRAQAAAAMAVLQANGWRPVTPRPETRLDALHADAFMDDGGRNLDLHWSALWELPDDADLWAGAVETTLNGVPTRALGHADQLLQVCVHGLRWASVPPIRWVADATRIVEVAGDELDWQRVVRIARANELTLGLQYALGYLAETFAVAIPPAVLVELEATPTTAREHRALRASMRRPNPAQMLRVLWTRHRRLGPESEGFVSYVQHHVGLERRRQLPGHVVRQLRTGRWRRAR